jgi:polygalacturonase
MAPVQTKLLSRCLISLLCFLPTGESKKNIPKLPRRGGPDVPGHPQPCRAHTVNIKDFGAVGDGKACNTAAFKKAIAELAKHEKKGGGMLVVPAGKWLTGPFNLTSHFTLFLEQDAVILASNVSVGLSLIFSKSF